MKALILAAGEGTRLRPLTLHRPKPMLPIGGVPMLEHLVNLVARHGITEVAINLHYKPEAIVEHFQDGSRLGVSITYSREEELLGSAGAARQLDWFLDDTFVVLYGDVLTDLDLSLFAALHARHSAAVTLGLYEAEDPTRCGMVKTNHAGRVERFIEKPGREQAIGLMANAGIYIAEPSILQYIPRDRAYDFGNDLFPDLLRRDVPMYAHPTDAYVLDIGSPRRYAQAQTDFNRGSFRAASRTRPLAGALVAC